MPRSPSRDRADRFTGNRGYFHQPDGIRRVKNWLALAALGLTGGWAVVDATTPQRVVATHTHGPVASVHAAWDHHCEACHKPESLSSVGVGSLFRAGDRWLDLTCGKCHTGTAHHAAVADKSVNDRCENCHHDHGGRTNSLVKLTDQHCTSCHADLRNHTVDGAGEKPPYHDRITGFADATHPEFRSLARKDRGLKFSHALHMAPGQLGRKDARPWSFGDPEKDTTVRDRYTVRDPANPSLVQLRCESCHQLDSDFAETGRPGGDEFARLLRPLADQPKHSVLPPRAAGAYYLPVNFDAHCKTCHPIDAPATKSEGYVIESFPLPHRKQPAELKKLLQGEFAARLTFPDNPMVAAPAGPGGRLDPRSKPGPASFLDEVRRLADRSLQQLMAESNPTRATVSSCNTAMGCGKCHHTTDEAKLEDRRIAPVPDRSVWLPHAKFNHAAHRATACAACHPGTDASYLADGITVDCKEPEPVRILGIESCRACHNPTAGVRHDCTDCHKYHDGDHPFRGRGAAARSPDKLLDVTDFLIGGKTRTP